MKKFLQYFFVIAVLVAIGLSYMKFTNNQVGDPDRYYHFSVSRQMAEQSRFRLTEIPQIKGLHWDQYFPDKEFLFHQFTALGYRLYGELGASTIILLIALSAVFLLYLHAAAVMPWWLALCLSFSLAGWGYFLQRLCLLRPQVPAILFFVILLHGIFRRSRHLCFYATILMALSYHGIFIPFTPILIAAFTFFLYPVDKKKEREIVLWSLFGLVIGVVINPYFPSNLVLGWIHAQIPYLMKHDLSGVVFGNELYPVSTVTFKHEFLTPTLVLFLAFFSLKKNGKDKKIQQDKFLFTLTASAFFAMAVESPRAAEYWIPTSIFLTSILYVLWEDKKKYANGIIVASMFISIPFLLEVYHSKPQEPFVERAKAAIDKIKIDPKKSFVFNYGWDMTPYLLYLRPDLYFVDILDPSLLYFTDKSIFWARQKLITLRVGDQYAMLKSVFHADYALSQDLALAEQLRKDPDFLELYPGSQAQKVQLFLFELREHAKPNFLHEFKIFPMHKLTGNNFREKTPDDAEKNSLQYSEQKSDYLDLSYVYQEQLKNEKPDGDINCARVDLDANEMKKFIGAEYFGVGGGRNVRIWRNGKPFYTSVNAFINADKLQLLVQMPEHLKVDDQFSLISCSSVDAPYWGVSASFWTKKEIEDICAEKHTVAGHIHPDPFNWQYTGVTSESCLGPILSPNSTKLTHD